MKKLFISIVLLMSLFMLTSCGKNELVGTWLYFDGSAIKNEMFYVFNEDKTGSYNYYGGRQDFIYETKDNKITFKYIGSSDDTVRDYKVEKNTLTIKDGFNNDITYQKK